MDDKFCKPFRILKTTSKHVIHNIFFKYFLNQWYTAVIFRFFFEAVLLAHVSVG